MFQHGHSMVHEFQYELNWWDNMLTLVNSNEQWLDMCSRSYDTLVMLASFNTTRVWFPTCPATVPIRAPHGHKKSHTNQSYEDVEQNPYNRGLIWMTIKSNAPDQHHHFANISNIFLWSPRSHWVTHRAPLTHPALPSEPIARTPYGGLVWPKSANFRTRRIPKLRILKSQKSGSREPVFEVKFGPKNWFPIWTQKLVPDLDPKTGDDFRFKTWFPFWQSKVVPISNFTIWRQLLSVKMGTKFW